MNDGLLWTKSDLKGCRQVDSKCYFDHSSSKGRNIIVNIDYVSLEEFKQNAKFINTQNESSCQ